MTKTVLLAAIAVWPACARPEYPVRLLVQDSALLETVERAALEWNDRLGDQGFTVVKGGSVGDDCRDVTVQLVDRSRLPEDAITVNKWDATSCQRKVEIGRDYVDVALTTHELGHLLRVPHNPDERSVMHPDVYDDSRILPADLEHARHTIATSR